MLSQLFNIIAPVAIAAAVGFFWKRTGREYDVGMISALVTNIGTPCLVFSTLVHVTIAREAFYEMALATMVTLSSFLILAAVLLTVTGTDRRTFLPSMIFANVGNMGLPLCLFAFGPDGLALAVTYFAIHLTLLFTVGEMLSAGSLSIVRLMKQPFIYAAGAALVFLLGEIPVPLWIANTTKLLGDFTIPLMLITLGISLAGLKIGGMKRSVLLALLRLAMGFAVGVTTAHVFGLEGISRGVLIVQSTMPVAVFNYLFAVRNGNSPEEVAGVIVISTAVSFATLPALMWFAI